MGLRLLHPVLAEYTLARRQGGVQRRIALRLGYGGQDDRGRVASRRSGRLMDAAADLFETLSDGRSG